ncbi:MAG: hypothetical protein JWP12_2158 [Bacteroidetes bacterium]|nr:hypothetical protein [Bacteroidota bacterium]
MQITTDKQTYEGEIAAYWFDNGISLSKILRRTVASNSTDQKINRFTEE